MEKTTKIVGHSKEIQVRDTQFKPINIQDGIQIYLKDDNVTIELLILPLKNNNTNIGNYTITIKEP